MITLYPHQEKFITELRAALSRNKCVMGQAATGFGKTQVGAFMVKNAIEREKRVFFMVHRRELVEQTSKTFDRIGIEHGFIQAGRPLDPLHHAQVVSIDTLVRRLGETAPPDLLIVDECHHMGAEGWKKVHAWAAAAGAFIVGLSATPWRLDRKGLDSFFSEMVQGPKVAWLIENGYLSRYRIFAPSSPDMHAVKIVGGDFEKSALDEVMDNNALYGCAVDNWVKLANGKKTIAFCPSVKVSERMVTQFIDAGVRAAHLDGNTLKKERADVIRNFADGKVDIISNVGLFGEGFDLSAIAGRDVPIEAVILYRPTMSLSLHLQQIGRALRPKPYPAIILDHSGNCVRHGFPDDDFNWTLKARKKKKKSESVADNIKQCPHCMHVHKPAATCPECGHIYEVQERASPHEIEGDLKELDRAALEAWKKARKQEFVKAKTLEELIELGVKRGYKNPRFWANKVIEGREQWKKKKQKS